MLDSVHKMHAASCVNTLYPVVDSYEMFCSFTLFLFRLDDAFDDSIILFEHVDDNIIARYDMFGAVLGCVYCAFS